MKKTTYSGLYMTKSLDEEYWRLEAECAETTDTEDEEYAETTKNRLVYEDSARAFFEYYLKQGIEEGIFDLLDDSCKNLAVK